MAHYLAHIGRDFVVIQKRRGEKGCDAEETPLCSQCVQSSLLRPENTGLGSASHLTTTSTAPANVSDVFPFVYRVVQIINVFIYKYIYILKQLQNHVMCLD